jgi:hypothetical protein
LTGTFTLFAGVSPAGTGTVPAGVRGHVVGVNVLGFTGTFQADLPTRGYVGEFDANCNEFECETPIRCGRHYVVRLAAGGDRLPLRPLQQLRHPGRHVLVYRLFAMKRPLT